MEKKSVEMCALSRYNSVDSESRSSFNSDGRLSFNAGAIGSLLPAYAPAVGDIRRREGKAPVCVRCSAAPASVLCDTCVSEGSLEHVMCGSCADVWREGRQGKAGGHVLRKWTAQDSEAFALRRAKAVWDTWIEAGGADRLRRLAAWRPLFVWGQVRNSDDSCCFRAASVRALLHCVRR